MNRVLGWDIGGVNTKVVRVQQRRIVEWDARPYEIQRDPRALCGLLRDLARSVHAGPGDRHAVTMTAELSQAFRTKREGVASVLDEVVAAFPDAHIRVYAVDGRFLDPGAGRAAPLTIAAANWAATARLVAQLFPEAILIDIGSTTTDIIPIVAGRVSARGRTDPARLREGELVYTGALRTPAEAIASSVAIGGERIGVAAEGFALAADVHLWRGQLAARDYSVPTPDGRPATREFAGERLARVVCADREMLDDAAITAIADGLWAAQLARIGSAIAHVLSDWPALRGGIAVVTGLGDFLAVEAARRAGLQVTHLSDRLGPAARHAAAAAVALLLAATLEEPEIVKR